MRKKTAAMLFVGMVFLGGSLIYRSAGPVFAQVSAAGVNGQTKIVKLVDGRTMTGVVRETKEGIEIETKFGVVKFTRDQIASMEEVTPTVDEYAERKAKIDLTDAKALFELARWVWENHRKDEAMLKNAQADLQSSLELDPENERAKLLLTQVNAAIGKTSKPATTGNIIKPVTGKAGTSAGTVQDSDKYLVSQDDIYWIRLMELAAKDNVSVNFKNNVLNRYMEIMKGRAIDGWDKIGNDRRFMSLAPSAKVHEIIRNQFENVDLLKDIQITRDPSFMVEFRSKVWPMAKQYCAASQCHGGPQPRGGFKLFVQSNNVKADYTNFIILAGLRGAEGRKLIDRDDVDSSLFLQYGLNQKVSRFTHPKVNNSDISFMFPTRGAKNYKTVSKWIQSLTRPAPNYHLQYKVPFGMKVDTSGRAFNPSDSVEKPEK